MQIETTTFVINYSVNKIINTVDLMYDKWGNKQKSQKDKEKKNEKCGQRMATGYK